MVDVMVEVAAAYKRRKKMMAVEDEWQLRRGKRWQFGRNLGG